MMKDLFSVGVYKEMLRKISIAAIIAIALFSVFVIAGVIDASSLSVEYGENITAVETQGFRRDVFGVDEGGVSAFAVPYAGAVLAFVAFSFVMKRKSSDFYHALPVKRTTVYFSGMCAIATAVASMLILPMIVGILTGLAFGVVFVPSGELLLCYLNIFTESMAYAGAATVAVSVTGMYLPVFMLTLVIIILPRAVYSVCEDSLIEMLPFIWHDGTSGSAIEKLLIPEGFYAVVNGEDVHFVLFSAIKTAILLIFGGILFAKRKSETAEKSAPNRILQYIYGALAGFAVTLIIFQELIEAFVFGKNRVSLTGFIMVYGLAFIFTAAFELITTKRIKNIRHSLVSFVAALLMDVLLVIALTCSAAVIKKQRYQLKAVQIPLDGYGQAEYLFASFGEVWPRLSTFSYDVVKASKDYFITDEAILKKTEELYDSTLKQYSFRNSSNGYSDVYFTRVRFVTRGGKELYRKIINENDETRIIYGNFMRNDENFRLLCTSIPQKSEISIINVNVDAVYTELDQEVYDSFARELESLTFDERLAVTCPMLSENSEDVLLSDKTDYGKTLDLCVSGTYKGEYFFSEYPVAKELMPETYKLIENRLAEINFFMRK